jgi:hypothetical protein
VPIDERIVGDHSTDPDPVTAEERERRNPGLRPPRRHPFHQHHAAMNRQTSISVHHEPPGRRDGVDTPSYAGGPPRDQSPTPHTTVNNLSAQDN